MKNYCIKKYSVEALDNAQDRLTCLINEEKRAKIFLNRYTETVKECEKMLEANEGLKKISEETYLKNKEIYESDMCRYREFANSMIVEIEDIEKEIEELREKYCL
jgi:hypothetical protein